MTDLDDWDEFPELRIEFLYGFWSGFGSVSGSLSPIYSVYKRPHDDPSYSPAATDSVAIEWGQDYTDRSREWMERNLLPGKHEESPWSQNRIGGTVLIREKAHVDPYYIGSSEGHPVFRIPQDKWESMAALGFSYDVWPADGGGRVKGWRIEFPRRKKFAI
jgi:hypothetical protein